MSISPTPICNGCGKKPSEIHEYIIAVKEQEMYELSEGFLDIKQQTPEEYVRRNEGTYNHTNGHFLCTSCYIEAGMPSNPWGWKAP